MRDYDIESDLKQEKFQHLKLVQGDRGNKIKINVYEDGQPVNLTGCSITAKYKRADGQIINGSVTNISNNSFDAVIDSDITKVVGTLKMLFSIEKDDVKVSTFLLLADVREGLLENTGSSGGSTGGGEVTVDLSNYYKKNETYSKAQIDSQFKDIANEKFDDITLSDNKLTLLANGKTKKTITLPTTGVQDIPCQSIVLNNNSLNFNNLNPKQLSVTVTPSNTTDKVIWTVSPEGIATVNNGVVTPVKDGNCIITVTCGEQTATCNIVINTASSTTVLNAEWEIGSIKTTGENIDSTTCIRTKDKIYLPSKSTLNFINTDNKYQYLLLFMDANNKIIETTSFITTENYYIPCGVYVRILVKMADGGTVASDLISTYSSQLTISTISESSNDIYSDGTFNIPFSVGIINIGSGAVNTSNRRLASNLIHIKSNTDITIEDGFDHYLVFYNESGVFKSGDANYFGANTRHINDECYAKITIKNNNDTTISSYNDYCNLYNSVKITSSTTTDVDTPTNPNLFSVEALNLYSTENIEDDIWEIGSIKSTGENIDSTTCIRTKDKIYLNMGDKITCIDGYSFIVMNFIGDALESFTDFITDYVMPQSNNVRIILKNNTSTSTDITIRKNIHITKYEVYRKFDVKIEGVGLINNTYNNTDLEEYSLCAIKNRIVNGKPNIPIGYLYHSSLETNKGIYYSASKLDTPAKIKDLSFNPNGKTIAISPKHGDIIFLPIERQGNPIVLSNSTENTINITTQKPVGWLDNCGCDFGIDSEGNEFFIFGEYTGVPSTANPTVNIWKVTYPYTEISNWNIVKSFERTSAYTASEEGKVWHIHTIQRDPYTNIWYCTTGDEDLSCTWWYSTDEGTTWIKLHDGTVWDSQVARVLNFVFTKDFIYWANDWGTNHSLNRIKRNSDTNVIDISTYEKLTELNKAQSTYATCYLNYPNGILMLDRTEKTLTNSMKPSILQIQFYSFDDEKLYNLKTLSIINSQNNVSFGFRAKCATLYQGIYDNRIAVGFDKKYPFNVELEGNESMGRTSLLLTIF
mgnify:CR=1 FL=1|nr:MAG TPA: Ig-like domain protein [Caudoviricetes sp.]